LPGAVPRCWFAEKMAFTKYNNMCYIFGVEW